MNDTKRKRVSRHYNNAINKQLSSLKVKIEFSCAMSKGQSKQSLESHNPRFTLHTANFRTLYQVFPPGSSGKFLFTSANTQGAFVWDQSGIRIIGIMRVSVCLGAILILEYLDFHSGYSTPRSRIAGIYSGINSYTGISQTNASLIFLHSLR